MIRSNLLVIVLLNTLDIPFRIQRGGKLGYTLPVRSDYEEKLTIKRHLVKNCSNSCGKGLSFKKI